MLVANDLSFYYIYSLYIFVANAMSMLKHKPFPFQIITIPFIGPFCNINYVFKVFFYHFVGNHLGYQSQSLLRPVNFMYRIKGVELLEF